MLLGSELSFTRLPYIAFHAHSRSRHDTTHAPLHSTRSCAPRPASEWRMACPWRLDLLQHTVELAEIDNHTPQQERMAGYVKLFLAQLIQLNDADRRAFQAFRSSDGFPGLRSDPKPVHRSLLSPRSSSTASYTLCTCRSETEHSLFLHYGMAGYGR